MNGSSVGAYDEFENVSLSRSTSSTVAQLYAEKSRPSGWVPRPSAMPRCSGIVP